MKTLGIFTPFLMGTYPGALVSAIYARARAAGLDVLLLRTGSQNASYEQELCLERADAWIVILNPVTTNLLRKVHASGRPVCVIGHDYGMPELGLVRSDNAHGIHQAMQHLYDKGHRRFAYIGPSTMDDALERQSAFESFVHEHLDCTSLLVETKDFSYAAGQEAVDAVLERGANFTALIAATDNNASGAISALKERRIRIPEDIAVTGFDNSVFARMSDLGITTLDQTLERLANTAVDDVFRRVENPAIPPVRIRIEPKLILRESSGDVEPARTPRMIDKDVAQSFIAISEEMGQLYRGGRKSYLKHLEFRLRFANVIRLTDNGQRLQIVTELPQQKDRSLDRSVSLEGIRKFPLSTDKRTEPEPGDFQVVLFQEGGAQGTEVLTLCFRNTDLSNPLSLETLAHEIELLCYQLHVQMMSEDYARALETLRATQDELLRSEKNVALGNVIAGIAHELNTPLGNSLLSINTLEDASVAAQRKFSEGLLKRTDLDELFGTLNIAVQIINRNLGTALRLLGDFKQINSEQSSAPPVRISLQIFMQDLLNMLQVRGEQASVKVSLSNCSEIEFETYPQLLAQVLNELVKNALTHGLVGTSHGEIRISALSSGSGILLTVEDNGIGLSESASQKIFDPFFTTRMGTASGLGLTMVHNLVTGPLNGKIIVESIPGVSTKFDISLPLNLVKTSSTRNHQRF